jgi:DNA ligase (NAD+)
VRDIGKVVNESIKLYFSNQQNINMIKEFISLGVNPISNLKLKTNLLNNQTFVITGRLLKPREYYKTLIEINGGNIISSISSKTDYLLIGEKPGSKLSKAEALNINVVQEEKFMKMLEESNE